MSDSQKKVRTSCYKSSCGPVVKTGFRLVEFFVCKTCGEEVSERLAGEIEERIAIREEGKDIIPDGGSDDPYDLFGFGGYVPGTNSVDPDDYI